MRVILKTLCIVSVFCLCLVLPAAAQQQQRSASATPEVPSSGRPSSVQIQQNILNQKRRALNSQIDVAQRCIANASRPEVLRDPEGNVNIVPSTDIVNCTRTLEALLRQLDGLGREAQRLAQDAQVEAAALQRLQKQLQAQKSSVQQLRRRRVTGRAL
ncbi:MAG: hypothetical protein ACLP5H_28180 [Desulfomonilaceae bacterium]